MTDEVHRGQLRNNTATVCRGVGLHPGGKVYPGERPDQGYILEDQF